MHARRREHTHLSNTKNRFIDYDLQVRRVRLLVGGEMSKKKRKSTLAPGLENELKQAMNFHHSGTKLN